jgi:hypothetical protein
VLLPVSIPEIVYPKIAGCLIALVPAAAWLFLGLLIYPDGFSEAIENVLGEVYGWFFIAQYIFFWLLMDSGELLDQQFDEGSQQCFSSSSDVVNKLEEPPIQW